MIAPKIIEMGNLIRDIEREINDADHWVNKRFDWYKEALVVDGLVVSNINALLEKLERFFEVVDAMFHMEEDKMLLKTYRDWKGVNVARLPFPSHVQWVACDIAMVTPEMIDKIREQLEEVEGK